MKKEQKKQIVDYAINEIKIKLLSKEIYIPKIKGKLIKSKNKDESQQVKITVHTCIDAIFMKIKCLVTVDSSQGKLSIKPQTLVFPPGAK